MNAKNIEMQQLDTTDSRSMNQHDNEQIQETA